MGYVKDRWIESMEPKEEIPVGIMKDFDRRIRQGGDDAIAALTEYVEMIEPRWIPVEERLPVIAPLGVTANVIVAHAEYTPYREPTGLMAVSPAAYIGSDAYGAFFKSMVNGRRLDAKSWMPLPEPPAQ